MSYKTAAAPHALRLHVDVPSLSLSRDSLAFVTVEVVDTEGALVPDADLPLAFTVGGGVGELAALGNGDPQDIDSTHGTVRRAWRGKALAVLRPSRAAVARGSGGTIKLAVSGKGVGQAQVEVQVGGAVQQP